MNYPIGDFLIRIKNGYMAGKKQIPFPYSKAVFSVGKILEKEGYIQSISETRQGHKKSLWADLLYRNREPVLHDAKIVSKPSVHAYVTNKHIPRTRGGFGLVIISTSRGMMTGADARKQKIGGKVICQIF